jgi:uncharacterized membrane protein
MAKKNDHEIGLTTSRLETLVDGIFTISMTLLVLTLTIPHITREKASATLPVLLFGQMNDFFSYCLSFLLLAVFWMLHHKQYHTVERTDGIHLWINILLLMFVTLIPFTTSLITFYPELVYTNILFHLNMFLIGFLFYCDWNYATKGHRLVAKDLERRDIQLGRHKHLVTPIVALLALVLSFFFPAWSTLVYIAIPLLLSLVARDRRAP